MEASRETNISDRTLQTRLSNATKTADTLPKTNALHRAGKISARAAAIAAFESTGLGNIPDCNKCALDCICGLQTKMQKTVAKNIETFDKQISLEAVKPGMTPWAVKKYARQLAASLTVIPLNETQQETLSLLQAEGLKQTEPFDGIIENRFITSAVEAKIIKDRINRIAKLKQKDAKNGPQNVGSLETETLTQILTGNLGSKHGKVKAEIGITIQPGNYVYLTDYGPVGLDETIKKLIKTATWWNIITLGQKGHAERVERYKPNTSQKRFLKYRDTECRWKGCGSNINRADIDHTTPWSENGKTTLTNLAYLCRRHHTAKHHSGWKVEQKNGGYLEWTSPTGKKYVDPPHKYLAHPKPPNFTGLNADYLENTKAHIRYETKPASPTSHPPPF